MESENSVGEWKPVVRLHNLDDFAKAFADVVDEEKERQERELELELARFSDEGNPWHGN